MWDILYQLLLSNLGFPHYSYQAQVTYTSPNLSEHTLLMNDPLCTMPMFTYLALALRYLPCGYNPFHPVNTAYHKISLLREAQHYPIPRVPTLGPCCIVFRLMLHPRSMTHTTFTTGFCTSLRLCWDNFSLIEHM